jgi:hypothetical protein
MSLVASYETGRSLVASYEIGRWFIWDELPIYEMPVSREYFNDSKPVRPDLLTSWIASFKKCLLADTRRFWPKLYYFFSRLIQKFHFLELTLVFHQNPMFLVLSI